MNNRTTSGRPAFSLVELVIVIVIIGIIAAIAVPRFSSATASANDKQAKASAVILQNALDRVIAEHAPGAIAATGAGIVTQVTAGTAMAAMMPMITTTITSSTSENASCLAVIEHLDTAAHL